MQGKFRVLTLLGLVLIPLLLLAAAERLDKAPSRMPLPDRQVPVRFEPIHVPGASAAWTVVADDPRFGGISALAVAGVQLLALTDSGVTVTLPDPRRGGVARLHDLPTGPGEPNRRRWRDSEALLRDPAGRWWVAFENRHSLWRYDPAFSRAERTIDLRDQGWALNKGVEAIVALPGDALLLLPERAGQAVLLDQQGKRLVRIERGAGEIADAVRLADGRVLVLVRTVGIAGIGNQLMRLVNSGEGYALRPLMRIAVGPLTNLEAMAAQPLPDGRMRLWIMSDNDFSDWRSTVLLAVDLPAARPGRP